MNREQKVSRSRFEFEENGEVAYLEFDLDGSGWMTLWHTEVPPALRGRGVADTLARTALEYARDNKLKLDVICPVALNFHQQEPRVQGPRWEIASRFLVHSIVFKSAIVFMLRQAVKS